MSRDKQIEEMGRIACVGFHEGECEHCPSRGFCSSYTVSRKLYNAGYRKSEDVAREIFEEAIKLAKEFADNSAVLAELEESPIKRIEAKGEQIGALIVLEILAELKKKYESEKDNG